MKITQAKTGTNIINTTHLYQHPLSMPRYRVYVETMA